MNEKYRECFELIDHADRVCVLTGAGVSTLSGIPDFRGRNGFFTSGENNWHGHSKEELFDIDFLKAEPEVFYQFALEFLYPMLEKTPSIAHTTLAAMQTRNICQTVFTQNIDNLHGKAGGRSVVELHGTMNGFVCLQCGDYFSLEELLPSIRQGKVPYCPCGGLVKPDVIFYGEALNENALTRAFRECEKAEVLLVMGTSLTVNPVASLPQFTKMGGGKVVIVNSQATSFDPSAAFCFDDIAGFCQAAQEYFHLQA